MPQNERADTAVAPKANAVMLRPTAEAVRDVIADSQQGPLVDKPSVVGLYRIVFRLLGFDPLSGKNTDTRYGGRSKDSWINEHLSMSTLRKVLDCLVETGEVVKVSEPSRFTTSPAEARVRRAVCFPYQVRTGYLLADTYAAALDRADSEKRDQQRARLLVAAKDELAGRHADELSEIYARLCGDAGLSQEQKGTTTAGNR